MLLYTNPGTGQAGCECGHLPYTITLTFSGLTETSGECLPRYLNGQTVVLYTHNLPKLLVRAVVKHAWVPEWVPLCVPVDTSGYDGVPGPIPGFSYTGIAPDVIRTGLAAPRHVPPTISLLTHQGSGATFTPILEESVEFIGGLPAWTIVSVDISGSGSGYVDGGVMFWSEVGLFRGSVGWNEYAPLPILRVRTREQPTVLATLPLPAGEGAAPATLNVTLARNPGYPATWSVASVEVADGGAGYPDEQAVVFSFASPSVQAAACSAIAHVGEGGVVQFVRVHAPGSYYRDEGRPVEVEVVRGGLYYSEDRDLPPHVAPITVEIEQLAPSNGSGAVLSPEIDLDPHSPTFGYLTGVSIVNPGGGYTLLGGSGDWQLECESGGSMQLQLTTPAGECEGDGRNLNMHLQVAGLDGWIVGPVVSFNATFQSEGPVVNAGDLPAELEPEGDTGGSVALTAGGKYIGPRGPCCGPCPASLDLESVESITVTIAVEHEPCDVSGTATITLQDNLFEQKSQQIGDIEVRASLGAVRGFYFLTVTVLSCFRPGFIYWGGLDRSLRMEAVRHDGECVPVGFGGWGWQQQQPGQQYVPFVPGNEIPDWIQGLSVSVAASVALK